MNLKKKIVFLCQFFYPETISSARLPYTTAKEYVRAGYDVSVVCGYPKEYLLEGTSVQLDEVVDGIHIHRVKYRSFSRKSKFGRLVNFFSFTLKCFIKIRLLWDSDYLFVYSNPPILPYVAYKAGKRYGTKVIFVCYDIYPEIAINTGSLSDSSIIARTMRYINKKLFVMVHKVVVLSNDMKVFIATNRNVEEKKISVIPNWYQDEDFNISMPNKRNDIFTFSYMGNIGTCQDIITILDAAIKLKQEKRIKFIIGGHGNKIPFVHECIEKNNLKNVEVKPFLTGNEYIELMSNSDCYLVSLVENISSLCFPSKYYSYLFFGKPIIAIMDDCELTKEIVSNNIGFHVSNKHPNELVKAINTLLNMNKRDYSLICQNSKSMYLNYSINSGMKKYLELLNE